METRLERLIRERREYHKKRKKRTIIKDKVEEKKPIIRPKAVYDNPNYTEMYHQFRQSPPMRIMIIKDDPVLKEVCGMTLGSIWKVSGLAWRKENNWVLGYRGYYVMVKSPSLLHNPKQTINRTFVKIDEARELAD